MTENLNMEKLNIVISPKEGEAAAAVPLEQELEAPADFTSPEVLYQELVASIRRYHPSDDISMIEKAYHIAKEAHKDQKRKSGEPYIIHPLCVAIILADLEIGGAKNRTDRTDQ